MKPLSITPLNTLSIIITFNPDNGIISRLKQHYKIVENIVVVDNNSSPEIINGIYNSFTTEKLKIITSNENKGIAWALNQGVKYAIENGFKFVITFDQDSTPYTIILSEYAKEFMQHNYIGCLSTIFSSSLNPPLGVCRFKNKLTNISSGSLYPIDIFSKIGLFNEDLFIDSVDFEFSLRIHNAGYKTLRSNKPLIIHHLGAPKFKFGIKSTNHNAVRRYYIARNNMIITKKYFCTNSLWIIKKNIFFIISIFQMMLVDDDKYNKLVNSIKGIADGLKK